MESKWEFDSNEGPVLVDWDRSGADHEPALHGVKEGTLAHKIISGYCPVCEEALAGIFKKEAHKFDCEIYRTCCQCHTVFSYVEEAKDWYSDLYFFIYNGSDYVQNLLKYIRIYPNSPRFGFSNEIDLEGLEPKVEFMNTLLYLQLEGSIQYNRENHDELLARGLLVWEDRAFDEAYAASQNPLEMYKVMLSQEASDNPIELLDYMQRCEAL